ncbi:MAG TPA: aspartate 1-decarboxylase, partial [Methanomassiliicoccales archaeon]|nr:aspartate 1-decarboxylase [Methanomassiliicoccales archaeon]
RVQREEGGDHGLWFLLSTVGERFKRRLFLLRSMRQLLRGKIHRATVTAAEPEYVGSIVIDQDLLERADIWAGERVLVSDVDNGARFETYVVPGRKGSGVISVNGAAAHLVNVGDKVIIMAFELTDRPIPSRVVLVDQGNRFIRNL